MAKKITPISRAVPGAERNRTRLKAPATATPAPTLPLTSIMTIWTTAGRMARVMAKLWVHLERNMLTSAVATPRTRETAVQIRKAERVIWVPIMELSMEKRLVSLKIW